MICEPKLSLKPSIGGRPSNQTVKGRPAGCPRCNRSIVRYLDEVYYHTDGKLAWGILTDGKTWRLFSHRAASRSCNYYEVDLEGLLHTHEPSAALQEIQFHSWFAFDTDGYYLNNKAFFVPSGDRYLLALLNSSVTWWFLSAGFSTHERGSTESRCISHGTLSCHHSINNRLALPRKHLQTI